MDFFWPKIGKNRKRSEKVGKRSALLIETCFSSGFLVDFGEVLGVFWEAKREEKSIFLLVLGVCFLISSFCWNFVRFLISSMAKNVGFFIVFCFISGVAGNAGNVKNISFTNAKSIFS